MAEERKTTMTFKKNAHHHLDNRAPLCPECGKKMLAVWTNTFKGGYDLSHWECECGETAVLASHEAGF